MSDIEKFEQMIGFYGRMKAFWGLITLITHSYF